MEGLLARKLGMTQIYLEDGRAVPCTVLKAGPCVVTQRKTEQRDGYEAAQIGLVEGRAPRTVSAARKGHFKASGSTPVRSLAEVALSQGDDPKPGDELRVGMFAADRYVDVIATSKGKGFAGVMKRHNFRGGRSSHGSMFHRAPGSIGASAFPSRVLPGLRGAGQLGDQRTTAKNLEVVRVIEDENLLFVRGAVPGGRNGLVLVRRAYKGRGLRKRPALEAAGE